MGKSVNAKLAVPFAPCCQQWPRCRPTASQIAVSYRYWGSPSVGQWGCPRPVLEPSCLCEVDPPAGASQLPATAYRTAPDPHVTSLRTQEGSLLILAKPVCFPPGSLPTLVHFVDGKLGREGGQAAMQALNTPPQLLPWSHLSALGLPLPPPSHGHLPFSGHQL